MNGGIGKNSSRQHRARDIPEIRQLTRCKAHGNRGAPLTPLPFPRNTKLRFRRALDVQKEVEGLGIQGLGGDPSIDMSKTSGYMLYPRVKRSFMGPNLKRDSMSGLGEVAE
uniref:Uncharacterized protein n=1 Tax=Coccidioides posadasii RMSCC 3488 TaxID=454284 RepID=A0A0J6FBG8_COCPO|nr:hypothetical protein CPAG_06683 [Coccidioides posadasii RMSCC 3488]